MKVVIVGGVAGGASCAARLRRLDENAHILMVERGPYVSYANCGLPYHVGVVVARESSLLVADERVFREQFAIDLRHPAELAVEQAPGVVNIPLPQLRQRLAELPRDREIHVICRSGQRAYYATRILLQSGFKARTVARGMLSRTNLVGSPN